MKGCLIAVAIPVLAFAGLIFFGMAINATKSPEATAKDAAQRHESDFESAARLKAKKHVEASLRSPSTADFPWLDWKVTKAAQAKETRYVVYSYVDSQNGFGATVRTNFRVVVQYNGGDPRELGNWQVVHFEHN